MPGRSSSDRNRSLTHSDSSSQSQHQSQAQEPDHPMNRQSNSAHSSNPNVFSDDYSVEPIDSEQTTLTPSSHSVSSFTSSSTLRSVPVHSKPANTPTSEHEPVENPFGDDSRVSSDEAPYRSSIPEKGVDFVNRNSIGSTNTAPSTAARSQSNSSRLSIPPRALSPYTGATGPSHPYAMYPQVGVGRSPSSATMSTMRPGDRPLTDPNAPQHPYAMYPQNVVIEEGMDDGAIPLGFPGHNQAYRRPSGRADDDVGDLVGPDGHTEQLPPYTRYPDGAVPVIEGTFEAATGAGVVGDENSPGHLEEEARDAESSPRPLVTDPPPTDNSDPPEEAPTGVMAFEEKLKTTGRKKACCGLPIWTLVLVCVVILVVACVGGIIGGVLGTRKAARAEMEQKKQVYEAKPVIVTVTATPQMDATPVTSVPHPISTLPTGRYVLPASPKNQSKFCVADSDYKASWGCVNKGTIPIDVHSIDRLHGSVSFPGGAYSGAFTYGAQAPYLPVPTQSMIMVEDTNQENLGPALYFKTPFDKLVVVPQDAFPSDAVSKRVILEDEVLRNASHNSTAATPGQSPWFCWWNNTIMEFFLYVNETTNEARYGPTISSGSLPTLIPSTFQTRLPSYPRRIKIEERRDYPDSKSPYCQQMSVLKNGTVVPAALGTIGIKQVEPTPTTTLKGSGTAPTQTYTAIAEYQSPCYCVSLTD